MKKQLMIVGLVLILILSMPLAQAFILSGVRSSEVTEKSAVIEWNTDLASDSVVTYGTDTDVGEIVEDDRLVLDHSVRLGGLSAGTAYYFKVQSSVDDDTTEDDEDIGDDFENLYKGEISKSGTPILPSKRARKTPEKIQVTKEDLAELSETAKADVDSSVGEETVNEEGEVSLEEVSHSEEQPQKDTQEDQ